MFLVITDHQRTTCVSKGSRTRDRAFLPPDLDPETRTRSPAVVCQDCHTAFPRFARGVFSRTSQVVARSRKDHPDESKDPRLCSPHSLGAVPCSSTRYLAGFDPIHTHAQRAASLAVAQASRYRTAGMYEHARRSTDVRDREARDRWEQNVLPTRRPIRSNERQSPRPTPLNTRGWQCSAGAAPAAFHVRL